MARVFISYSTRDWPVVEPIVSSLEDEGHECYVAERDIRAGKHLSRKVMGEIDGSDVLVVFLSEASSASPWVQQEIGHAKRRIPIVPVRLDEAKPVALLEGVEAVPLVEAITSLSSIITDSIESFEAEGAREIGEKDGEEDELEVCEAGPHEVEPGGYVALGLRVSPGLRYEGIIEESDDEAFDWVVIDQRNYLAFKRKEEYRFIAGEQDVTVGEVKFRIPLNRRGPWYLLLTAPRKQNVRVLTVEIVPDD